MAGSLSDFQNTVSTVKSSLTDLLEEIKAVDDRLTSLTDKASKGITGADSFEKVAKSLATFNREVGKIKDLDSVRTIIQGLVDSVKEIANLSGDVGKIQELNRVVQAFASNNASLAKSLQTITLQIRSQIKLLGQPFDEATGKLNVLVAGFDDLSSKITGIRNLREEVELLATSVGGIDASKIEMIARAVQRAETSAKTSAVRSSGGGTSAVARGISSEADELMALYRSVATKEEIARSITATEKSRQIFKSQAPITLFASAATQEKMRANPAFQSAMAAYPDAAQQHGYHVSGLGVSVVNPEVKSKFGENTAFHEMGHSFFDTNINSIINEYLTKKIKSRMSEIDRLQDARGSFIDQEFPQGSPERHLFQQAGMQGKEYFSPQEIAARVFASSASGEGVQSGYKKFLGQELFTEVDKAINKYLQEKFNLTTEDIKRHFGEQGISFSRATPLTANTATNPYPEMQSVIERHAGQAINPQSIRYGYEVDTYAKMHESAQKLHVEAQTLKGDFVQLQGRVNVFGEFVQDVGKKSENSFRRIGAALADEVQFGLMFNAVYDIYYGFRQMVGEVISLQTELAKVQVILGQIGTTTGGTTSRFLSNSISTGIQTGTGFNESTSANLQAFRLLAGMPIEQRMQQSSRLGYMQLGAQTTFGMSAEQSQESINAMFTQIRASLTTVQDPAQRSVMAIDKLGEVLDKLTYVANRSGVEGSDLVQTYAQLASSFEEMGASPERIQQRQNELISLTSAAAPILGISPSETANSIKNIMERVYGEGSDDLAKLRGVGGGIGIATRENVGGEVRIRDIVDILRDVRDAIRQNPGDAKSYYQAIGGQRRANQAAQLISSLDEQQRQEQQLNGYNGAGDFNRQVGAIASQFGGVMKGLGDSFAYFMNTLLFSSGFMDDLAASIAKLRDGFKAFSDVLNDNPQALRMMRSVLEGIVLVMSGFIVNGVKGVTALTQMIANLGRQFNVLTGSISGTNRAASTLGGLGSRVTSGIGQMGGGRVADFVNQSGLRGAGNIASTLAIPIALDLAMGSGTDQIGVGIGTAVVGYMVGGPGGAAIGYAIGSAFAQSVDVGALLLKGMGASYVGNRELQDAGTRLGLSTGDMSDLLKQQDTNKAPISEQQKQQLVDFFTKGGANNLLSPGVNNLSPAAFDEAAMTQYERYKNRTSVYTPMGQDARKYRTEDLELALKQRSQISASGLTPELAQLISSFGGNDFRSSLILLSTTIPKLIQSRADGVSQQTQQQHSDLIYGTASSILRDTNNKIEYAGTKQEVPLIGQTYYMQGGTGQNELTEMLSSGKMNFATYQAASESMKGMPDLLGRISQLTGTYREGLDDVSMRLYRVGSDGQKAFSAIIDEIQAAIEFTNLYAAKQEQLTRLESFLPNIKPEDRGYDEYIKTISADRQFIEANKVKNSQALELLNYMREQHGLAKAMANIEKETAVARSITIKGQAAKFTPPGNVDVSGTSIDDVIKALAEARERQNTLSQIMPEYKDEFSKEQFMLQSGMNYRGVTGTSQSLFNQALQDIQKKRQEATPQFIDLRKYTPDQITKAMERAQKIQDQVHTLVPELKDRDDKSRLLILQKNNDLLLKVGLSNEYLSAALEDNTDAQLRGHYNLPAGYRPPTVWDYYNDGGTTAGDVNYPGAVNGMVPISTIEKALAAQGTASEQNPDISQLGDLVSPGSAPLGYPNPGSPDIVYEIPGMPGMPSIADPLPGKGVSNDPIANLKRKYVKDSSYYDDLIAGRAPLVGSPFGPGDPTANMQFVNDLKSLLIGYADKMIQMVTGFDRAVSRFTDSVTAFDKVGAGARVGNGKAVNSTSPSLVGSSPALPRSRP